VFLFAISAPAALAQQPPDGLTDQQRLGRQVLFQSCAVCHLPPGRGARTYGPVLHTGSNGGGDALMRTIMTEGTPRVRAELGLELTPLEEGLRETYRWYRQQQRPQPDFSWEDRLLVSAR
jgi:hypothetical protein